MDLRTKYPLSAKPSPNSKSTLEDLQVFPRVLQLFVEISTEFHTFPLLSIARQYTALKGTSLRSAFITRVHSLRPHKTVPRRALCSRIEGFGKKRDHRHVSNPFKARGRAKTTPWQKATSAVAHSSVTSRRNKRPREVPPLIRGNPLVFRVHGVLHRSR